MLATDTETTGLLAPSLANLYAQPYITQIYVAKVDENFEIYEEFETYLKPKIPIPPFITKFTGIDDEMVKGAPEFIEIYDDLCEFFLGEDEILGQNIPFDLEVLQHELERHGMQYKFPWPKNLRDTVEKSFPIFNKRLKLGQLYEHCYGHKFDGAHTAKADTQATIACWKWLVENGY